MAGAKFLYENGCCQIAAPSANIPAGKLINHAVLGACLKEGLAPHASGAPIHVRYAGIIEVPAASGTTFSAGAEVQINSTTDLAVASGDFAIGRAVVAKTSGQLSVLVQLNVAPPS